MLYVYLCLWTAKSDADMRRKVLFAWILAITTGHPQPVSRHSLRNQPWVEYNNMCIRSCILWSRRTNQIAFSEMIRPHPELQPESGAWQSQRPYFPDKHCLAHRLLFQQLGPSS
jgi:hypothetical protein